MEWIISIYHKYVCTMMALFPHTKTKTKEKKMFLLFPVANFFWDSFMCFVWILRCGSNFCWTLATLFNDISSAIFILHTGNTPTILIRSTCKTANNAIILKCQYWASHFIITTSILITITVVSSTQLMWLSMVIMVIMTMYGINLRKPFTKYPVKSLHWF